MRILLVNGSPRPNGNTDFVLKTLGEAFMDYREYRIGQSHIHPCTDCRACKSGSLSCLVQDEMQPLYKDLEKSDLVVMGSPIYWSGVTGPMKNMLDRLRPYYQSGKLKGKKWLIVSVGSCADKESDLIDTMYARMGEALQIELVGHLRVNGYDEYDVRDRGFIVPDFLSRENLFN